MLITPIKPKVMAKPKDTIRSTDPVLKPRKKLPKNSCCFICRSIEIKASAQASDNELSARSLSPSACISSSRKARAATEFRALSVCTASTTCASSPFASLLIAKASCRADSTCLSVSTLRRASKAGINSAFWLRPSLIAESIRKAVLSALSPSVSMIRFICLRRARAGRCFLAAAASASDKVITAPL